MLDEEFVGEIHLSRQRGDGTRAAHNADAPTCSVSSLPARFAKNRAIAKGFCDRTPVPVPSPIKMPAQKAVSTMTVACATATESAMDLTPAISYPAPRHRRSGGVLAAMLSAICWLTCPSFARAEQVVRAVNVQQDAFVGHDGGGYTSGVFAAQLRVASPDEEGVAPTWLLSPLASWIGTKPTLASFSVGQIMLTPENLSREERDPADVPYLGALFVRAVQVHVRAELSDFYALSLGVIGPAAGAAKTQRAVHRVTGSEEPRGWSQQVPNRALVEVERYWGWRRQMPDGGRAGASSDLIALGGATVGTLESSVGSTLMIRYGRGLQQSFPTIAAVGWRRGDPLAIGSGWFGYAAVTLDYHAGFSGGIPSSYTADFRRSQNLGSIGMAFGWKRASLTFALQSASPLIEGSHKRQSWGSLTLGWNL